MVWAFLNTMRQSSTGLFLIKRPHTGCTVGISFLTRPLMGNGIRKETGEVFTLLYG